MTNTDELPGWTHVYSGKVRDLYVPTKLLDDDDTWTGDPLRLSPVVLVVASDRVSAFDHVLEPGDPRQGRDAHQLSLWWFDQLPDVPNHLAYRLDDRLEKLELPELPAEVAERAMLVPTLDMFPIECVVRGYLTGGGWAEYQSHGSRRAASRCPPGSQNGDRLPEPIYTPAFKAPMGEHDENISFERTVELVGEAVAEQLRDAVARDLRARRGDRRGARPDPRRHEVRVRRRSRHGHRDARRRGAHERLVAVLGCRGVRDRRDARAAHGELRQADRARLARRELGPGRGDAARRCRTRSSSRPPRATASCSSGSPAGA